MRAKEYLQRYKTERQKVNKLRERIAELDDLFSITQDMTSDRVQSSPRPDRLGEIIAQKSDLEEDLWDAVIKSVGIMNEIEDVINQVPEVGLQALLQKRYIKLKTWECIAEELDYSYRWTCVLHGRALQVVEGIINEMGVDR